MKQTYNTNSWLKCKNVAYIFLFYYVQTGQQMQAKAQGVVDSAKDATNKN